MATREAIAILDSIVDIFEQLRAGNALGIQVREIARRLHLIRTEIRWTHGHAILASRLRATVVLYAMSYAPDGMCAARRARNKARLDDARAAFTGLREHLEREAHHEGDTPSCWAR